MSNNDLVHKNRFPHFLGLDGIRGLAILLVMLSHFLVVSGKLVGDTAGQRLLLSGYLGVDLFFVLSGFLITGILLSSRNEPHYFGAFYWRRSLRIFPLYYFTLTVAALSVIFITPEDAPLLSGKDSPAWYWLYISNIGMTLKGDWLIAPTWIGLGHFWSLAVEEQFYFFWPLIVYFLNPRTLAKLCLAIVLASPFIYMLIHNHWGTLAAYVSTLGRIGELSAGAGIALMWRNQVIWQKIKPWITPFVVLLLTLLFLERTWVLQLSMIEPTLALLGSCGLVALAIHNQNNLSKRIFESAILRWLGKYSYGIYVYHHALAPIWKKFFWQSWIQPAISDPVTATICYVIAATSASLFLAWVSWHLLEAPCLSYKNRFFQRPSVGNH